MIANGFLSTAALMTAACLGATAPAAAQVLATEAADVVEVTLLPGWREADGTHIAGLKIKLAPGWKTYWRAPGDGGVPTSVDLSASDNLAHSQIMWPTPSVFRQNGMRSIGYRDEVIVPIALRATSDAPITLRGHVDFGVCEEFCLPVRLDLEHLLPPDDPSNVEALSAALENRPVSAEQANVRAVDCTISYGEEGHARMNVTLDMPALAGRGEAFVIEPDNPTVWVSEPTIRREGDLLEASAEIASPTGDAFKLDLDKMRFTVLTTTDAVDIRGCK